MESLPLEGHPKVWARVFLDHLVHNYLSLLHASQAERFCCVVKADAYGHGAVPCCQALCKAGANFFAVSSLQEAIQVRSATEAWPGVSILILGYTPPEDADLLIRYDIHQAILSEAYAKVLNACVAGARAAGTVPARSRVKAHIKLDTGMNRIGFSPEEPETIAEVCSLDGLEPVGIFTHFAKSDEPESGMTEEQYSRFTHCLRDLEKRGIVFRIRHVCNSAAITNDPDMHLDMVRGGIELYGMMPSPETAVPKEGLLPCMAFETVVSHIHTVKKGETIGYGGSFRAERDLRIATLPVGYADGFIRSYAKGCVYIGGRPAPIRGRICMDQCMADVTDIPAEIGDTVTLFGTEYQTADDLANLIGTISYEVLCLVGKRVPRIYSGF
ncbi:MAG: alanine racemase [Clostridia bacterium]|nr:alanine racemase [Clostridia bacterium]